MFTDQKRVTKSNMLAANAPALIDVPVGQFVIENEPRTFLKDGVPIGSKIKILQRKEEQIIKMPG